MGLGVAGRMRVMGNMGMVKRVVIGEIGMAKRVVIGEIGGV